MLSTLTSEPFFPLAVLELTSNLYDFFLRPRGFTLTTGVNPLYSSLDKVATSATTCCATGAPICLTWLPLANWNHTARLRQDG